MDVIILMRIDTIYTICIYIYIQYVRIYVYTPYEYIHYVLIVMHMYL